MRAAHLVRVVRVVRVARALALATALFLVAAVDLYRGAVVRADDATPGGDASPVSLHGFAADQRELIEWALALYGEAGLRLPPLRFVSHPSAESCLGRRGAHNYADGTSTIHICTAAAGLPEEFLFLHELAHAWDRHSLTDERRAGFLRVRGLTEWHNDDPERWHDRGAEHAAEIMVWGLMDRPMRPVYIPQNSCAELVDGYHALTGRQPLHGYTDYC